MLAHMRLNITAAGLLALAVLVGFDRVLEGSTGLALPGQSGPRIFVPSPSAKLWLNDNPLIAEDTREPLKGKTAANTPPEIMSGWPLTESTTQALSIPPLRAKVPVYLFESVLNL